MSNLVCLRSSLTALVVISIGASTLAAQSQRTVAQKLDSIAGHWILEDRNVGAVVAVVKGNDTLRFKSYGKANVELDVPMLTDPIFEIGSITKQFTASAILQLRDQGKLNLDDDITKWLPDFDTRGNKVPLRRLLDHTSGITDVAGLPEFRNLVRNTSFPADSMYALIKRHPFQFPTGTAQVYNNSAYWLLGSIIEKASGMSYDRYVETRLFEPLGMKGSMVRCSLVHRLRRAVLDGGRPGHLAQGAVRRQSALACFVCRDDQTGDAQRRNATPVLDGTPGQQGRPRSQLSVTAARSPASRRGQTGIPTRRWRSSS